MPQDAPAVSEDDGRMTHAVLPCLLLALAALSLPAHVAHRLRVLRRRPSRPIASYGYYRGHRVVCFVDEGDTCERFASDLALTVGEGGVSVERPCVRCGLLAEPEGPDPCLGRLPGVVSACCGHGVEAPYVLCQGPDAGSERGPMLRGEDALGYFTRSGVGPRMQPRASS